MCNPAQVLEAAYAELPARQSEALRYRVEQRLSYREIARELNTTPAATNCLLQRARKRVRAMLAEAEN